MDISRPSAQRCPKGLSVSLGLIPKSELLQRKQNFDELMQKIEYISQTLPEDDSVTSCDLNSLGEYIDGLEKEQDDKLREVRNITLKRNESRFLEDGHFEEWNNRLFIAVLKIRNVIPKEDLEAYISQILYTKNLSVIKKIEVQCKSKLKTHLILQKEKRSEGLTCDQSLILEIRNEWKRLLKVVSLENLVSYSFQVLKNYKMKKAFSPKNKMIKSPMEKKSVQNIKNKEQLPNESKQQTIKFPEEKNPIQERVKKKKSSRVSKRKHQKQSSSGSKEKIIIVNCPIEKSKTQQAETENQPPNITKEKQLTKNTETDLVESMKRKCLSLSTSEEKPASLTEERYLMQKIDKTKQSSSTSKENRFLANSTKETSPIELTKKKKQLPTVAKERQPVKNTKRHLVENVKRKYPPSSTSEEKPAALTEEKYLMQEIDNTEQSSSASKEKILTGFCLKQKSPIQQTEKENQSPNTIEEKRLIRNTKKKLVESMKRKYSPSITSKEKPATRSEEKHLMQKIDKAKQSFSTREENGLLANDPKGKRLIEQTNKKRQSPDVAEEKILVKNAEENLVEIMKKKYPPSDSSEEKSAALIEEKYLMQEKEKTKQPSESLIQQTQKENQSPNIIKEKQLIRNTEKKLVESMKRKYFPSSTDEEEPAVVTIKMSKTKQTSSASEGNKLLATSPKGKRPTRQTKKKKQSPDVAKEKQLVKNNKENSVEIMKWKYLSSSTCKKPAALTEEKYLIVKIQKIDLKPSTSDIKSLTVCSKEHYNYHRKKKGVN